jgi:hypothetical protein
LNVVTAAGMVPKSENWSANDLVNAMLNLKGPENPCALQNEVVDSEFVSILGNKVKHLFYKPAVRSLCLYDKKWQRICSVVLFRAVWRIALVVHFLDQLEVGPEQLEVAPEKQMGNIHPVATFARSPLQSLYITQCMAFLVEH